MDTVVRNYLVVEAKASCEAYIPLGRETDYFRVPGNFLVSDPQLDAIREAEGGLRGRGGDENEFRSATVVGGEQPVLAPERGPVQWAI